MKILQLSFAICAFLLCGQALRSQVDQASIKGTVTDSSGAVIQGAHIEAVSAANGKQREIVTDSKGAYTIPNLPLGTYQVTVSKGGFNDLRFDSVLLKVGSVVTLNARLEVATVQVETKVEATEPSLNQSSAAISGVIDSNRIENLPTNGRNWANLLILAPLAVVDGGGDQRSIRFSGHARDDNNYMMDGVDATGIQEQAQKSTTRLQVSEDAV